jgi:hypothetical protein
MIFREESQGAFKIAQAFHANYYGPRPSGSGGQVHVEGVVALLNKDKHFAHGYFSPLSGLDRVLPPGGDQPLAQRERK